MSDVQRRTSPPNSTNLSAPEDERILEEDRLAGGFDGAAHSRASADGPILPPTSAPKGIENENEAASSQQTSTAHQNVPRRPAQKETFFGLPQSSGTPANFNPNYGDDYEKHFPPDPIYEEASSPNARVYRVYMEESAKYDVYMTDEAREGLDVLLVFAGLFSAVLTTFVAQTSQSLQPDRATETTLLLREVASLQRAQMNGTSVDSIPSTPADFTPSTIDVWVNGLWFTSLTLSLVAALLAVLMKQWIRHYVSFVSGTAKERSLIRQYRFMGLQKWHVPTLIGILPVLMHLSLAIFFAGLTLFLTPLRPSIASIIGSLSTLVFIIYVATAAWPLFCIQCPYRTPLSTIIHDITFTLCKYVLRRHGPYVSLKELEHEAAQSGNDLVAPAFEWLISMSSNPSVRSVVTQAVGGFLRKSSSIEELANSTNESFQCAWHAVFQDSIRHSPDVLCIYPEKADLLERLFRSALHIQQSWLSRHILFNSAISAVIQSFPLPTLQWESAATAFLWHSGIITHEGSVKHADFAQKACAVVGRLMSDAYENETRLPHENETRLPVMVWEDLLAAASSYPGIVPFPNLSDPVYRLNKTITDELTKRVLWGFEYSDKYDNLSSLSFKEALTVSENFAWSLLSPFDKHRRNVLDSEKVQRLLSLVYAIVSRGLCEVSHDLFIGTCTKLIYELHTGSVTLDDQEAVCMAMDVLLQQRIAIQGDFGANAVLLSSLLFLPCWKPHIPLRNTRKDIFLNLIELNVLHTFHTIESWRSSYPGPVAYLIASLIRTSFESRTDPGAQAEDSQWLEYLSLSDNSAAIVSIFTFQGTADTPASVVQVRDDLVLFFSWQSPDCDTLRHCKTSLKSHLEDFVNPFWRDKYEPHMKEAMKVIDEVISEQSPKPAPLHRLLRRSRKSPDPEARYPRVDVGPSPSNTVNSL